MKFGLLSKFFLSCTVALSSLAVVSCAWADGMIIPPPDYWVYETGQEAAIFFDQGQETLILTTNFKGEVKNFGWVVPVPTKPDVSKGSDEILENLREIVAVRYRNVGILEAPMTAGLEKDQSATVTVVETKKIDYLDLAVLTATDSQALANWLKDNGYQYPQESSWILNDYISNGWYFVAVKVSPESQNAPDVVQGLAEGHITPLKIVFQAQTPVFPLRISGIEVQSQTIRKGYDYTYGNQSMPINLYVITNNKVEATGFSQNYGNWIQKDAIKNLGFDFNGKPLIDPGAKKYFLTHLQRYMTPQEMVQMKTDLYLKIAEDNKLVNAVELKGTMLRFWLTVGIGLAVLIACIVVLIIWLIKKPSKK